MECDYFKSIYFRNYVQGLIGLIGKGNYPLNHVRQSLPQSLDDPNRNRIAQPEKLGDFRLVSSQNFCAPKANMEISTVSFIDRQQEIKEDIVNYRDSFHETMIFRYSIKIMIMHTTIYCKASKLIKRL